MGKLSAIEIAHKLAPLADALRPIEEILQHRNLTKVVTPQGKLRLEHSEGFVPWESLYEAEESTENGTITVQEGDVTVDASVSTLDFDGSDFNITSSPSGEANVALNYGTGAGQPSEGNHTHASASLAVHEGGSVVDATVTVLDFDASDFNVSSSPAGEANISLAYGTSAGTPAEGNHTHSGYQTLDGTLTSLAAYNTNGLLTQTAADTFAGRTITGTANEIAVANGNGVSGNPTLSLPTGIDPAKIAGGNVSATEFDYLNGVTSAIQTQIDSKAPVSAKYIVQTADATLTGEQALGALGTGIVKNTTTTGVLSIATGSDLPSHVHDQTDINFLVDDLADKQPADTTLDAFAAYNTNGLLTQTAADTFTGRTITGTANEISVANGNGVAGNPTLSLPTGISAAKIGGGNVTSTEFDYLDGVTSAIQTQIDSKAPKDATYIVQTANGTLTGEQVLGSLGTGIVKNTTTTGVLSIAVGADLPSHTHAAADVTSGVFNIARLATGTPDGTKYVRDDGTLASPSGTGAPSSATYIVQTADAGLSNEQALGSLTTGLLKNTTTTGVLSIAGASDLPTGIDAAKISAGNVSNTEFDYLNGVTSALQTQLDAKVNDTGDTVTGDLGVNTTSTTAFGVHTASGTTKVFYVDTSNLEVQHQNGTKGLWFSDGTTSLAGNVTVNIDGATGIIQLLKTASIIAGTGSPEASVTATVGSIYYQTNGVGAETLWLKQSGSGNTGWIAIGQRTPYSDRRVQRIMVNPGATTVVSADFAAAPTLDATLANADAADGTYLQHTTGTVSGNNSRMLTATTVAQRQWKPKFTSRFKTGGTITTVRYWVGLSDNAMVASATPTARYAAFRYNTATDGTTWRAVVDANTGSPSSTDTGVTVSADTTYLMRIECDGTTFRFYINDVWVASHASNIPSASTGLAIYQSVTTLAASARVMRWGWTSLEQI